MTITTKLPLSANLIHGAVIMHILLMTFQMMWAFLFLFGAELVSSYYISRVGIDEFTAFSFTFPIVMLFGSLTVATGTGVASLISRTLYLHAQRDIARAASSGLLLSFLSVIFFTTLGYFSMPFLISFMGAEEKIIPLINSYMNQWYMSMVFLSVPTVAASITRATGDARSSAFIMIVISILNVVIDPFLIFGLFGFPKLGLEGAAIGAIISRVIGFFVALFILQSRQMLTLNLGGWQTLRKTWSQMLKVGIPVFGAYLINPFSACIITSLLAKIDTKAVIAYGITSKIESVAFIILMSLSSALMPFFGQNWSSQRYDRVKTAFSIGHQFSILFGTALFFLFLAFREPLIQTFVSDRETMEIAWNYLLIVPLFYILDGFYLVYSAFYNGIGSSIGPVKIMALKMFIITVPAAYFGFLFFGVTGIFIGIALGKLVAGLIAFHFSRKIYAT